MITVQIRSHGSNSGCAFIYSKKCSWRYVYFLGFSKRRTTKLSTSKRKHHILILMPSSSLPPFFFIHLYVLMIPLKSINYIFPLYFYHLYYSSIETPTFIISIPVDILEKFTKMLYSLWFSSSHPIPHSKRVAKYFSIFFNS